MVPQILALLGTVFIKSTDTNSFAVAGFVQDNTKKAKRVPFKPKLVIFVISAPLLKEKQYPQLL